jgi:hypothetical protein
MPVVVDFSIPFPVTDKFNFQWKYDTSDGPSYDPFRVLIDTTIVLDINSGSNNQKGYFTHDIEAGQARL